MYSINPIQGSTQIKIFLKAYGLNMEAKKWIFFTKSCCQTLDPSNSHLVRTTQNYHSFFDVTPNLSDEKRWVGYILEDDLETTGAAILVPIN